MTTTITATMPTRVVNLKAILLPLFCQASLVPARRIPAEVCLASRNRPAPGSLPALAPPPKLPAKLEKVDSVTFSVPRVTGSISRVRGTADLKALGVADLALPPGISRYINGATLKAMLKADRSDLLLRKVGDAWEVCDNSHRVDLWDDAAQYRLGQVSIYS